jgi:hypothetical protein
VPVTTHGSALQKCSQSGRVTWGACQRPAACAPRFDKRLPQASELAIVPFDSGQYFDLDVINGKSTAIMHVSYGLVQNSDSSV